MARLNVAFWNIKCLSGQSIPKDRKAIAKPEVQVQFQRVADAVHTMFDGHGPDIFGVSEIVNEDVAKELGIRLKATGCVTVDGRGGLAIFTLGKLATGLTFVERFSPSDASRPQWLMAQLLVENAPILVVQCHWRSDLHAGGELARREAADRLQQSLSKPENSKYPVIVGGDFNCEPFAEVLNNDRLCLRTSRHARNVKRATNSQDEWQNERLLYNPCWNLLLESAETVQESSVSRNQVKTSHKNKLFDQVLVSREFLTGIPLRLLESTVGYGLSEQIASINNRGRLTVCDELSDHLPITASFELQIKGKTP